MNLSDLQQHPLFNKIGEAFMPGAENLGKSIKEKIMLQKGIDPLPVKPGPVEDSMELDWGDFENPLERFDEAELNRMKNQLTDNMKDQRFSSQK